MGKLYEMWLERKGLMGGRNYGKSSDCGDLSSAHARCYN